MNENQIEAIGKRVYARFPALKGVRPRVKRQVIKGEERFLLYYKTTIPLPDGASLPTIVRVVADAKGDILKLTASR